ncbi:unnamed protein product [Ixodes persulcatus]
MPRGGKCAVPSPAQGGPRILLSRDRPVGRAGFRPCVPRSGVLSPPFRPVGQSGPDPGRRPPSLRITVRPSLLVDLD